MEAALKQVMVELGTLRGEMKEGFESESHNDYARIWNPVEHFKYHQLGTSKIPQRVMMAFNKTLTNMIEDTLEKGIRRKLDAI